MEVNLEKECLEELGKIFKDIVKSNNDVIKIIALKKTIRLQLGIYLISIAQ